MTTEQQNLRFTRLQRILGGNLAIFILCAYSDVEYMPEVSAATWPEYLEKTEQELRARPFADGVTDAQAAILDGEADKDIWERVWGTGSDENPYTNADYRRLDELFGIHAARLVSTGGFDAEQEEAIRFVCRLELQRDKNLAKNDKDSISMANTLNEMARKRLDDEAMNRKNAKPREAARPDGMIDYFMQKFGFGFELTYDQVMEAISAWMKNQHYDMTQDAAEQVFLAIVNHTRINSDRDALTELPEDAKLDKWAHEFDPNPTYHENEAYKYLGLVRRTPQNDAEKIMEEARRAEQDQAKRPRRGTRGRKTDEADGPDSGLIGGNL